jgi:uncharacterized protein (UPF0335 family)
MTEETPGAGHNSLSPSQLLSYVEKIEKLVEDRKAVNEDIKTVLEDADNSGYDRKTIREVVKLRAMDPDERQERQELLDIYLRALGML